MYEREIWKSLTRISSYSPVTSIFHGIYSHHISYSQQILNIYLAVDTPQKATQIWLLLGCVALVFIFSFWAALRPAVLLWRMCPGSLLHALPHLTWIQWSGRGHRVLPAKDQSCRRRFARYKPEQRLVCGKPVIKHRDSLSLSGSAVDKNRLLQGFVPTICGVCVSCDNHFF